MSRRKNAVAKGFSVVIVATIALLSGATAFSFVPSCEEELAEVYPSIFQADLAACDDAGVAIEGESKAELAQFAAQLKGSWQRSARTVEGLPVDPADQEARLYFDITSRGQGSYIGVAMLVEHDGSTNELASSREATGMWSVTLQQAGPDRVSLALEQAHSGVVPASQQAAQQHSFYQTSGVFVSVLDESVDSNSWDRMILMDNSLTYVSCDDGVVERFVKTSDREPRVNGASLHDHWKVLNGQAAQGVMPAARDSGH